MSKRIDTVTARQDWIETALASENEPSVVEVPRALSGAESIGGSAD
jgi:hypothetical protein